METMTPEQVEQLLIERTRQVQGLAKAREILLRNLSEIKAQIERAEKEATDALL